MGNFPRRLCIRSKDICNITGYSMKKAREIINDIKVFHKKEKHQIVTVHEFSKYMGIPVEQIEPFIN
ncbi:hypothetical protein [Flavobacterium luteum]|uniref:Uncharacterized protein n=1 Tax=Flavobacterium luteum TaxID=2026654 RepID=A0A7J5AK08_9FLAO|nr:hypothetical protein [Flavobacterium luteum]KAB1157758.1 hypothetical protein F6464_01350 [Flavobacterium luteum]